MTNYKLSGDSKGETLVVIYDEDDPVTVPGSHPKFDEILTLLRSGEATDGDVQSLVNKMLEPGRRLAELTDRVSIAPYGVFFDGDPLRGELADFLLQLLSEDDKANLTGVAKFLENAAANQTLEGVDALYKWISNGKLTITPEGNFLAYKAISADEDGNAVSITSGTALVDGEVFEGQIPNPIGGVITMPRSEVTSETSVNCGPGLHAGTFDYAKWFAGYGSDRRIMLVEINPRDVVSVPDDHNCAKLRVSRYKVLEYIENPLEENIYNPYEDEGEDGYEDWYDEDLEDEDDWYEEEDEEDDFEEDEDEETDGDFTEVGPVDSVGKDEDPSTDTLRVDGSIDPSHVEPEKKENKLGKWFRKK